MVICEQYRSLVDIAVGQGCSLASGLIGCVLSHVVYIFRPASEQYGGLTFELLPNILGKIDDNDWVQREGQVCVLALLSMGSANGQLQLFVVKMGSVNALLSMGSVNYMVVVGF